MRHRLVFAALVVVLAAGNWLALAPVAQGDSWSRWTVRWYPAPTLECVKARKLLDRFIGPVERYNRGCMYPVRSRYRNQPNYLSGGERWVQIENTSPIWPAWGQRMEVLVSWDGRVARYDKSTKWCREWSFIVKVTRLECEVWNAGMPDMLVRMAYQADFNVSGVGVSSQHGASQRVSGATGPGVIQKWP